MTFDLPGDYVEGDSDGDNQLGLNEWTDWKTRSAMREFLSLDEDGDGFLTPVELGASGSSSSRGSTGSFASAEGGGFPQGGQSDDQGDEDDDRSDRRRDDDDGGDDGREERNGGQQPDSTPAAPAVPKVSLEDFEFEATSPQARQAVNTFGLMDKNHNTKIETEEWQASQRIRPQFEGAGIDISGEMEQDEFVKTLLWIQSQPRN